MIELSLLIAYAARHERKDRRVEYHQDGSVARTIVFYYDTGARAGAASSGVAVCRAVAYEGTVAG